MVDFIQPRADAYATGSTYSNDPFAMAFNYADRVRQDRNLLDYRSDLSSINRTVGGLAQQGARNEALTDIMNRMMQSEHSAPAATLGIFAMNELLGQNNLNRPNLVPFSNALAEQANSRVAQDRADVFETVGAGASDFADAGHATPGVNLQDFLTGGNIETVFSPATMGIGGGSGPGTGTVPEARVTINPVTGLPEIVVNDVTMGNVEQLGPLYNAARTQIQPSSGEGTGELTTLLESMGVDSETIAEIVRRGRGQ